MIILPPRCKCEQCVSHDKNLLPPSGAQAGKIAAQKAVEEILKDMNEFKR